MRGWSPGRGGLGRGLGMGCLGGGGRSLGGGGEEEGGEVGFGKEGREERVEGSCLIREGGLLMVLVPLGEGNCRSLLVLVVEGVWRLLLVVMVVEGFLSGRLWVMD